MRIGVLREAQPGESRVALVPEVVAGLCRSGVDVSVVTGAGSGAWFSDADYVAAGAQVGPLADVVATADVLVGIHRPDEDVLIHTRAGQTLVGLFHAAAGDDWPQQCLQRGLTVYSLDGIPRTLSRAQSMDALTSQANVAGYKAVLLAAAAFGRYFPMLTTAAGTAPPATVLVLGAGVAGLQAIGTARRLGAVVSAYDVRPEARGDAESVGASFLDLPGPDGGGTGTGYARALTDEEQRAQQEALAAHIARHDIVVTTAQVPGRRPPLLVPGDVLARMRAGSVVVDIAAGPLGGNVEGSVDGREEVVPPGVTIIGAGNLPATVPTAASNAYARNVAAFLTYCTVEGEFVVDPDDDVQRGCLVTRPPVPATEAP